MWLRLGKLISAGIDLSVQAKKRFEQIASKNADWKIAEDEKDEFNFWMSGTGDPGYREEHEIDQVPTTRDELVKWLKQERPRTFGTREDEWRQACSERFDLVREALSDLALEAIWPVERWREALNVWSEPEKISKTWRSLVPMIEVMSDDTLLKLIHSITWFLRSLAKLSEPTTNGEHSEITRIIVLFSNRVLDLPVNPGTGIRRNGEALDEPVAEAINHPIGHVAEALLNTWFNEKPNDNDRIPLLIEPVLNRLCDLTVARYRHGRVILSSRLIALFRIDRPWTVAQLLPLYTWVGDGSEARSVWKGFLWTPRVYLPLFIAFKPAFLALAYHYAVLGEHGRPYAGLLTYIGLNNLEGYSTVELRTAVSSLPQDGLERVGEALWQGQESAAQQREVFWSNRVEPFWKSIWPKSREKRSGNISAAAARVALATGSKFPEALKTLEDWLVPVEFPSYIITLARNSGVCAAYPEQALRLLNAVIGDDARWAGELGACLEIIRNARPRLVRSVSFERLQIFSRRHVL